MYRQEISTERKVGILVGVLFLNLILISTNVVLKNRKTLFQNIVGLIAAPFQIGFQVSVDFVSRQLRHYVFLKDVYQKYSEMKKGQARLKYENWLLRRQVQDEAFLAALKTESLDFIEADVISVDKNFPLESVLINKGSTDGITGEMVALNSDAQLVGRIVEPISPFTAKVRLITSAVGGVGAYIKKNKLEGLLAGDNSRICLFKYLIENKPVFVGDEVVSSGTDQLFPPYLPIGRVVRLEREYLIQDVYVEPFFVKKPIKKLIIIKNRQR